MCPFLYKGEIHSSAMRNAVRVLEDRKIFVGRQIQVLVRGVLVTSAVENEKWDRPTTNVRNLALQAFKSNGCVIEKCLSKKVSIKLSRMFDFVEIEGNFVRETAEISLVDH